MAHQRWQTPPVYQSDKSSLSGTDAFEKDTNNPNTSDFVFSDDDDNEEDAITEVNSFPNKTDLSQGRTSPSTARKTEITAEDDRQPKKYPTPVQNELFKSLALRKKNNGQDTDNSSNYSGHQTSDERTSLLHSETTTSFYASSNSSFYKPLINDKPVKTKDEKSDNKPDDSENFELLAKLFPGDPGAGDIVLMLISIALSGVSVIPNYKFGGAFGIDFAQQINSHLKPNELEDVKIFSALMSAVINGYINARSVNNAVLELWDQGKKITIPGNRVKAFFGLLWMLSLAGIATVPNLQFIEDTLKDWTKEAKISMKVVIFLINQALNLRGVSAVTSVVQAAFGKENRNAAAAIRLNILSALSKNLSDNHPLKHSFLLTDTDGVDSLTLLSEGTLYRDKHPILRGAVSAFALVAPVAYSFGAYFYSAKKAMLKLENIENTDQQDPYSAVYITLMGVAYTVSTVSFLMKWAFLSRVNYNLVQRLFNHFLAETIIPQNDKIKVHPALMVVSEILHIVASATSLTGGFGMVDVYLFLGEKSLKASMGAIAITLLAAIAINYADPKDINATVIETVRRSLIRAFENYESINKDKFGETKDDFILKSMLNIAQMPDSKILSLFGPPPENTNQNTEKAPLINQKNNNLEDILKEIRAINDNSYKQFLVTYGRPVQVNNSASVDDAPITNTVTPATNGEASKGSIQNKLYGTYGGPQIKYYFKT